MVKSRSMTERMYISYSLRITGRGVNVHAYKGMISFMPIKLVPRDDIILVFLTIILVMTFTELLIHLQSLTALPGHYSISKVVIRSNWIKLSKVWRNIKPIFVQNRSLRRSIKLCCDRTKLHCWTVSLYPPSTVKILSLLFKQ